MNFTFNWSSSLFACSNLLLASFNHICNSANNLLQSRSLFSPFWASAFLTYREKNQIKYKFLSIIRNIWLHWQVESIMWYPCYSHIGLIHIKATQFQESNMYLYTNYQQLIKTVYWDVVSYIWSFLNCLILFLPLISKKRWVKFQWLINI
jgi:hypothetical protein